MGFLSLTFLLTVMVCAYTFRLSDIFGVDLWGAILQHDSESWTTIVTRNFAIFFSLYLPTYLVLYESPIKSMFLPYKLNKRYPPGRLVLKEVARCVRGILIASVMEAWIHELNGRGACPVYQPGFLHMTRDRASASPLPLLLALALGYLYGDFHFYWTHRLLHAKPLYSWIHSYHHQSFNPDPFSGLSMHAVESAVYFSSAFSMSFFAPLWLARLMFIALIIFPLEGHAGFGSWNREETVNHYIHHSKFEWNYGSSPLWDKLMGTDYKLGQTQNNTSRQMAAAESARLAGSALGKGFDGEAIAIEKQEKDF